jgi:hypothetical protein
MWRRTSGTDMAVYETTGVTGYETLRTGSPGQSGAADSITNLHKPAEG